MLGDQTVTLVCPEKSCVYPQHLPDGHTISDRRFAMTLERKAPRFLYSPSSRAAAEAPKPLYLKTDTHFTDYGAHAVAKQVCDDLRIPYSDPSPAWFIRMQAGDLGGALDPRVSSENFVMQDPPPVRVSDNGLRNRGRVCRYTTSAGSSTSSSSATPSVALLSPGTWRYSRGR